MTSDSSIRLRTILLVFFACIFRNIHGEQKILEEPLAYQEVSSGDNVTLRFIIQDKAGACMWRKDGRFVQMQSNKYEWSTGRGGGNCTLLIKRVNLLFDDGIWQGEVGVSDFTRQDGLISNEFRLVVKGTIIIPVKPKEPELQHNRLPLNDTLILHDGQELSISCISRYGNPPAVIKWFIGDQEVEPVSPQTNTTEVNIPKTWMVHSILRVRGQRKNHGVPIRCVAIHPTSLTPNSTMTKMDIYYLPKVRLEMSPQSLTIAPEDLVSFLNLSCLADTNPAPTIKWFKDSVPLDVPFTHAVSSSPSSLIQGKAMSNNTVWSANLPFEPVTRNDVGLYSCRAMNIIGESAPASYRLDVQYEPELKSIDGNNNTFTDVKEMALLGSTIDIFECLEYEANPPVQYKWVHLRGNLTQTIENSVEDKSNGQRLHLQNIMWSDEGEYRCIAFNTINGVKRERICDKCYMLNVTGPPEIQALPSLGDKDLHESVGWVGEPVHTLKSRFCSRPPPKAVTWQWENSHIQAGENILPKYQVLPMEPIVENEMVTNCYWAKLNIKNLQKEDAGIYTLLIVNDKGQTSMDIKLIVRDRSNMRITVSAVAVVLLFLLVLIFISVYSLLKMRRGRYPQRVEMEDSIASDALYENGALMDQQKSINLSHTKTSAIKSNLEGGQDVCDYSHIANQTRATSPEALKIKTALPVLQGTIV